MPTEVIRLITIQKVLKTCSVKGMNNTIWVVIRRVCIDYRKLNTTTRKDHNPLPFIDQMLDRLAGHPYFYFLDGYSGHNQIAKALDD